MPKLRILSGRIIASTALAITVVALLWNQFGDGYRKTVTLPNENLTPPSTQKYVAPEQTKVSPHSTPSSTPIIPATPTPEVIEPPVDPFAVMEFDKGNWTRVSSIDQLSAIVDLGSPGYQDVDLIPDVLHRGAILGTLNGEIHVLSRITQVNNILDNGGTIFVSNGNQTDLDPLNFSSSMFSTDRLTKFILKGGKVIFPENIRTSDYYPFMKFTLEDLLSLNGLNSFKDNYTLNIFYMNDRSKPKSVYITGIPPGGFDAFFGGNYKQIISMVTGNKDILDSNVLVQFLFNSR